uniref:Uncharacterized protein n=1 Tax=Rhizophora mucronata TaxID=61149 RepID=A0A2P2IM73_RHIMU
MAYIEEIILHGPFINKRQSCFGGIYKPKNEQLI